MKRIILLLLVLAIAAAAVVWTRIPPKYVAYEMFGVFEKKLLYDHMRDLCNTNQYVNDRSLYSWDIFLRYHDYREAHVKFVRDIVLDSALQEPGIAQLDCLKNERDKKKWLRQNLKVEFLGGSQLLMISMEGENPDELVKIVHAVCRAYEALIKGMEQSAETRVRATLEDTLKTTQTQLDEKAAEIKTPGDADLGNLMAEWYHLKKTHDETAAKLEAFTAEAAHGPSVKWRHELSWSPSRVTRWYGK